MRANVNCLRICPFYGQSIDPCDVGSGYISPYHVEVIVRHCASRYEDCARYEELNRRYLHKDGEEPVPPSVVSHQPTAMLSGGSVFPLQFDREVMTVLNHELRTPLTSIRSFTEILLSYPADDHDTHQRFLQIIREETVRLTRAMDKLFGSAESGVPAQS